MFYKIKRLKVDDAKALEEIEKKFFSHAWSLDDFKNALSSNNYLIYGIKIENKLVSYIVLRFIPATNNTLQEQKGEMEILNIATSTENQQKGLAHALLTYIIKLSKKIQVDIIFLDVRVSNKAAIQLYTKHNFIEIGRRKNYYKNSHNSEDAILMQRISIY